MLSSVIKKSVVSESSTSVSLLGGDNSEKGAAMVETAISLPVFLTLVLGFIQLSILGFNLMALQFTGFRAMRYASLAPRTAEQVHDYLTAELENLGFSGAALTTTICPLDTPACETSNTGGAGNFVLMTVRKEVPSIMGKLVPIDLAVSTQIVAKNQPY